MEKMDNSQESGAAFTNAATGPFLHNMTPVFSSPEPKAQGELIVWDSSRRLSVRACVRPHFQT